MRIAPALAALLVFSSFAALPVAPSFAAAAPAKQTQSPTDLLAARLIAANNGTSKESINTILNQEFRTFSSKKKAKAPKPSERKALNRSAVNLINYLKQSDPQFAYKVLKSLLNTLSLGKGNEKTKAAYRKVQDSLKKDFKTLLATKGIVKDRRTLNQDPIPQAGNTNETTVDEESDDDEDVVENPNNLSPNTPL